MTDSSTTSAGGLFRLAVIWGVVTGFCNYLKWWADVGKSCLTKAVGPIIASIVGAVLGLLLLVCSTLGYFTGASLAKRLTSWKSLQFLAGMTGAALNVVVCGSIIAHQAFGVRTEHVQAFFETSKDAAEFAGRL